MVARVSASRVVGRPPDDVFSTVTAVTRLPEWNAAITAVVAQPDHLHVGAQWVVEVHALGQTWHSRSRVETLDPIGRRVWRRVLLVRIRSRQLAHELARSLAALEAATTRPAETYARTNAGDDR